MRDKKIEAGEGRDDEAEGKGGVEIGPQAKQRQEPQRRRLLVARGAEKTCGPDDDDRQGEDVRTRGVDRADQECGEQGQADRYRRLKQRR